MNSLPKKLGKEPLIDVVFEVRFDSIQPASTMLPGMLFDAQDTIEKLPFPDFPKAFIDANPQFKYAPTLRVKKEKYSYLISDHSVAISAEIPYAGWHDFRPQIVSLIEKLNKSKIIKSVERFALKYVDLLDGATLTEQLDSVKLNLLVAGRKISKEQVLLRVELIEGSITHIVQLATNAKFTSSDGLTRSGLVIDVDSFIELEDPLSDTVWDELKNQLNKLHEENKRVFFDSLTPTTLTALEPTYD